MFCASDGEDDGREEDGGVGGETREWRGVIVVVTDVVVTVD